jgi:toxin ParE1/3/4
VTLVFHPLAEREFIAAARFYETRAPGLGTDFIRQVERAMSEIVARPKAGRLFAGNTIRRRLIQRFPFGVVYEIESANISVLAIMHLRRRPGYWQRRRQTRIPHDRS